MKEQHLLTPKDLTERFNVSNRTLARYIKEGQLPYVKVRGRLRFIPESINTFLRLQEENSSTTFTKIDESLPQEVRIRSSVWGIQERSLISFFERAARHGLMSMQNSEELQRNLKEVGQGIRELERQVHALSVS